MGTVRFCHMTKSYRPHWPNASLFLCLSPGLLHSEERTLCDRDLDCLQISCLQNWIYHDFTYSNSRLFMLTVSPSFKLADAHFRCRRNQKQPVLAFLDIATKPPNDLVVDNTCFFRPGRVFLNKGGEYLGHYA